MNEILKPTPEQFRSAFNQQVIEHIKPVIASAPKGSMYFPRELGMTEERFFYTGQYSTPDKIFVYRPRGLSYTRSDINAPLVFIPQPGAFFIEINPFVNLDGIDNPNNVIPVTELSLRNGSIEKLQYPSGDEWMFTRSGVGVTEASPEYLVKKYILYFVHGSDIKQTDDFGVIVKGTSPKDLTYFPHEYGQKRTWYISL